MDWVPMRWPAPWREPAMLEILRGTPVNCLVADWKDAAFAPLLAAGRKQGLAFAGLPGGPAVKTV